MRVRSLSLGSVLCLGVLACAPRDAGFSTVKTDVRERIGHAPRYRDVEGEEDPATARRVQALLAKPLDANAAVEIALLRSPRLQAAFTRLGVARAQLLGASLPPNPELEVELGIPEEGSLHWSFAVTENLSGLIGLPLERAAASAALARAQVQAAGDALDVAHDTRRAFYAWQAAEQELAIVRDVVTVAALTRELITRLHDAGNVTDLELTQARAFEQQTQLSLDEAEQTALEARLEVWRWLGGPGAPDRLGAPAHLPEVPGETPQLASLERRALAQSLDLRALDAERRGLERSQTAASVQGIVPELHAGVHAERDHGEWEVGPVAGIELPLFNHGQAQSAAADAALSGLVYRRQEQVLSIRAAAHAMRARLERAAATVRRYKVELLPLRRSIVEHTLLQYNAMQIGVRELLLARTAELDAKRAAVAVLLRYWLLRSDLDQLLAGRLVDEPRHARDATGSAAPMSPGGTEQGEH